MVSRVLNTIKARVPCQTSAFFSIIPSYWITISASHTYYGNAIGTIAIVAQGKIKRTIREPLILRGLVLTNAAAFTNFVLAH